MQTKEFFSLDQVVEYLDFIISSAESLGKARSNVFFTKIKLLKDLKDILISRGLPTLPDSGSWCYSIDVSYYAVYVYLRKTEASMVSPVDQEESRYRLIRMEGKLLTIDQYAEQHDMTEMVVRKHLLRGRLPYSRKVSTVWLIPELSSPIDETDLIGSFNIMEDSTPHTTKDGQEIPIAQNSKITILSEGRTSERKKIFKVIVEKIDPDTKSIMKSSEYTIGIVDRNILVFTLTSLPNVNYHSPDIGIGTWLYS